MIEYVCGWCGFKWTSSFWPRKCPNCGKKDKISEA